MNITKVIISKGRATESQKVSIMDTINNKIEEVEISIGDDIYYMDFKDGKELSMIKVGNYLVPIIEEGVDVKFM